MSNNLWQLSLRDASQALRSRKISALELTEATLSRITENDQTIGAFITVTGDLALKQARKAQARLDCEGEAAPLLTGIPVALKDLIDVAGVPTTAASRVLANNIAQHDAPVWKKLQDAGAVLVGKANTHEFAYGGSTEPTRNPWDTDRMVGGSSGGSAAALAAGMSFGAIGTDTAGSVRIPAAFTGVVGLKTSRGLVDSRGVMPLSNTLDCVGPMARTPEDAAILLSYMLDAHHREKLQKYSSTGHLLPQDGRDLTGLAVGVIDNAGRVSSGVHDGLKNAVEALSDAGAKVDEVSVGSLETAAQTVFTIMGAEASHVHQHWLNTRADKYSRYVRDRLFEAAEIRAGTYLDALETGRDYKEKYDQALADYDVLLLSSMPTTAPIAYIEQIEIDGIEFVRDALMCRDTAFANLTGHPALTVPSGLSGGLPTGVQIVGQEHHEANLFQVGQVLFERTEVGLPAVFAGSVPH